MMDAKEKAFLKKLIAEAVQDAIRPLLEKQKLKEHSELLTAAETAKLLHVSKGTLWNWERQGKLLPRRFGNRVLYDRKEIESKLLLQ